MPIPDNNKLRIEELPSGKIVKYDSARARAEQFALSLAALRSDDREQACLPFLRFIPELFYTNR